MGSDEPLMTVENLTIAFMGDGPAVEVVRGIDISLSRGRTLCLVGESGCGKSMTALALLGLLPRHARIVRGAIRFDGTDLVGLSEREMRALRSRRIAMIFQEPMSSLNPTMTVGEQIGEVLRVNLSMGRRQARARTVELLDRVRIPNAAQRVDDYPFAFSGGMRQRVMIALALACSPDLLIADEPTTALDVTVQEEILNLLADLREETGTALLLITHDLGVVAETADDVAVMYAGSIVERSEVRRFFDVPEHPYSIGLLGALPSGVRGRRLAPIEGRVVSPADPMAGCRFAPRCPFSVDRCNERPALVPLSPRHDVACWRAPLGDLP